MDVMSKTEDTAATTFQELKWDLIYSHENLIRVAARSGSNQYRYFRLLLNPETREIREAYDLDRPVDVPSGFMVFMEYDREYIQGPAFEYVIERRYGRMFDDAFDRLISRCNGGSDKSGDDRKEIVMGTDETVLIPNS